MTAPDQDPVQDQVVEAVISVEPVELETDIVVEVSITMEREVVVTSLAQFWSGWTRRAMVSRLVRGLLSFFSILQLFSVAVVLKTTPTQYLGLFWLTLAVSQRRLQLSGLSRVIQAPRKLLSSYVL